MTKSRRILRTDLLSLAQALDDPARVALLLKLADAPAHVHALAQRASLSRPTISYHLGILLRADLVRVERRGRLAVYRVNRATLLERAADIRRILR